MWLELLGVWKLGSESRCLKGKLAKKEEEAANSFKAWAWEPQNVIYSAFD